MKQNKYKILLSLLIILGMIISTVIPVAAKEELELIVLEPNWSMNDDSFWLMQSGVNTTKQLKVNGASGTFQWHSSDTSVAKVNSNGLVTAVGTDGAYSKTCTITATKNGKGVIAKCKVFNLKKIKKDYQANGVTVRLYEGLMNNANCGKARYYAAHIKLTSAAYNKMHIAKAKGARSAGFQTIKEMVQTNNNKAYNAILAVNGPFNGKDSNAWNAFSDGKKYTVSSHNYREIYGGNYSGGTLGSTSVTDNATYSSKTGYLRPGTSQIGITSGMSLKTAAEKNLISDTFHGDMGYTVLSSSKVVGAKSANYAQRTFIGTNGSAGNFWIVVCNGRGGDAYSEKGLNPYGEGEVLRRLGCKYGYNLDGGGSSSMIYRGETINKQKDGLRRCYDSLYIKK